MRHTCISSCVNKKISFTEELAKYLQYVRHLDFFETPDYDYLRKLFTDLMEKMNIECDWEFDWVGRQVCTALLNLRCFIYREFSHFLIAVEFEKKYEMRLQETRSIDFLWVEAMLCYVTMFLTFNLITYKVSSHTIYQNVIAWKF